jgi:hypothetical protein
VPVGKVLVLLLVVLVVLGFVVYTVSQRKWRDQALQGRKAAAMSFYNRLGSDVATLDPGGRPSRSRTSRVAMRPSRAVRRAVAISPSVSAVANIDPALV